MLTEEELKLLYDLAKLLKDSIYNREKELLLKDRDIRINFIKSESTLSDEWNEDKVYSEQENAAKEYLSSEEFLNKNIVDANFRDVEYNYGKTSFLINTIISTDMMRLLKMFTEMEFIQYEQIFQNVLYFCRVMPEDINEEKSYKLSWKKAKIQWENIFDYLKNYSPLGARPGKIRRVFKGNRILSHLAPYVEEEKIKELNEYSFSLGFLTKFVVDMLRVRKEDIITRHKEQKRKIKERADIIKANEEIDKNKIKELKLAKAEFFGQEVDENGDPILHEEEEKEDEKEEKEEEEKEEEEKEDEKEENKEENKEDEKEEKEFNEEEWIALYDAGHPKTPVPELVVIDVDEDFDIDSSEMKIEDEDNDKEDKDDKDD